MSLRNLTLTMIFTAFVYCAWLLWRVFIPLEIDANEGWNAFHILKASQTPYFYPAKEILVVNNYPPLSFVFLGWLHATTGFDVIVTGRVLSFISTLVIAYCIYDMLRALRVAPLACLFAVAWFLATMGRFFWGYMGMNDPSLLALCIMVFGFNWFLRRFIAVGSLYAPLFVMIVAGFFKHNHIVFPLVAMGMILLTKWYDWKGYFLFAILFCLVGLFLCHIYYGDVFFHNLFMPRLVEMRLTLINLGRLQWVMPALIIVGFYCWGERKEFPAILVAALIIVAFISNFLQKMGEGVGNNAQFELVLAVTLGLALLVQNISSTWLARKIGVQKALVVVFAVLFLRLIASTRNEPYLVFISPAFHQEIAVKIELSRQEVLRVRAIEGAVACSIKSICFYAGKNFVYDDFYIYELTRKGLKTPSQIEDYKRLRAIQAVSVNDEARWLIR